MASTFDTTDIPLIDFRPFLRGSPEDRARVAVSLDMAFKSRGFAYLSNHGIDQRKVDECFRWVWKPALFMLVNVLTSYCYMLQSKRFFDLSESAKTNIQPSGRSHHRGYSGVGREKVREHTCTKEGFGCGNPEDSSQLNIWPPEELLPGFRLFMEDFFWVIFNSN